LAGYTVFTGPSPYNSLSFVLQSSEAISFKQSEMKPEENFIIVTDLKKSFEEIHKKVETSSVAERAWSLRKSDRYMKENFEVEYYVLMATARFGMQFKTAPRWIRPFRFVTVLFEWVYAVERISTNKKKEVETNALWL
jgi:hypothetical protein